MRQTSRKALQVSLVLVLIAGCSQIPPTHFYVLELQQPFEARTQPDQGWDIGVRSFMVDAPYDQERIVYRLGDGSQEIHYYAYHHWAAPLSQLLAKSVAEGLGETEGVRSIEPTLPGRRYDAYLEGRVLAAEEVDHPDRQEVRLLIDLRLVSRDDEELWSESLRLEGSANTTEVEVIVSVMSTILADALAESRPALAAALAPQLPPTSS